MYDHLLQNILKHRIIPKDEQVLIANSFSIKRFKSSDWLIKPGTIARQLFFINNGVLKITLPHPHNKDVVYFFLKEHQFMTFLYSMYGNVPAVQGLQAACVAEVMMINYEQLTDLYRQLPYLRALIDEIAQLSMAEMVTIKNVYMFGEASDKYQNFLQRQPDVAKRVALNDIASYLGITPQSLSRIRRSITNSKVIF
ncbi:Crp/Fnr family transcriptional regulator [Mucilaginibacter jinjuensis]|uniref:Crp/Fnr family transcriptional regulator n=1 Tax=Mucilaginibacter jinjuensis TaxID=1176721 RepID=A0ABY7TA35_9SPHI|nr:Crp/Fnr family transcriptional regulator [Mucilaginibacter jinjuensis]WCT13276.1 Crp/Fnr family transcriptional regulator [Mucilaginibacter jinjuensis]